MSSRLSSLAIGLAGLAAFSQADAASHREAPLTALDRTADITDWYAFVSPDRPDTVTMILAVDPLLEPSNGPNYFPFDEELLYQLHIDNDQDAVEDITFEFRFTTDVRLDGIPVGFIGAGDGIAAPDNSPAPVDPGTPIIPPAVTALDGSGSEGINLRQTFEVWMVTHDGGTERNQLHNQDDGPLVAVPSNVGPRTMPNYEEDLFEAGIYELENDIDVFAGTSDDAFYIDLGAAFDSLNFREIPGGTGIPGVLSEDQDAEEGNFVADDVSGFNVNTIAIRVPIAMLLAGGEQVGADDPRAVIGTYGSTSRASRLRLSNVQPDRPDREVRRTNGDFVQIQRMGNPLFNELLIGTELKNFWSRSEPEDDAQFAAQALDPLIARVAQAAYGGAFDIPAPDRVDLLPVVTYAPPIAPAETPEGPIADLLRLNTGIPATSFDDASRLGVLGGDLAGFPNGRRPIDDVTDIVLRLVVGGVLVEGFNVFPNNSLGDGVNVNFEGVRETFPYVQPANDGRESRHLDPGEPGCVDGDCVD